MVQWGITQQLEKTEPEYKYDNNRTQYYQWGGQVRWLALESHRYPTLKKGDTEVHGAVIESLQRALHPAGAKPPRRDPSSKRFDEGTESAVKTFQSANGLPPSGIVDDAMWAALISPVRRH